jgi:antitoxin (DNA-binding transcriptional repressor) of toxin-antitoxin stability system
MVTFSIHEAKTHPSRLVGQVRAGETVILAHAGKPVAKLSLIDAPAVPRQLGFLASALRVPGDFDRLGVKEKASLFGERGHLARS